MREALQWGDGLTYTKTELDQIIVGKDACPESIAVMDLDGDGHADLIAIESPGYDYAAQELVALHGPSGRVVWRALKGKIGKRLALSDGIVVVEGDDQTSLHGVDARTGRPLWSTPLPGELKDDPYGEHGMTWNAPALTDHGTHVAFGCEDGSSHILESKTGRITKSLRCNLVESGHGIPGVVAFVDGGMSSFKLLELWDIVQNRSIMRDRVQNASPLALGPDGTFFVFYTDVTPGDSVPMTRAVSFDLATKQRRRDVWVTPSDADNVIQHNGLSSNPHRMSALGNDRLLVVSTDSERGGGVVIDLNAKPSSQPRKPPAVHPISRIPPPQPGFELRALETFSQTVVAVWENSEDKKRLMAIGLDRATLEPRWFIGDAGGTRVFNQSLRTEGALFLPFSPSHKEESATGAPVYWAHIDPTTGARVAQYTVRELDCVRMHGRYLLGHSTSFPGTPPIVWDTERRERAF